MRGVRTLCGKVGKGLGSDVLVETPATLPPPPPSCLSKPPDHRAGPKKLWPCQELGVLLVGAALVGWALAGLGV